MHSNTAVNIDEQKKPHMIMYYNRYKTGVDTMDPMVSRYTCHRRTQRWPLAMFFNIFDVGELAAYLIYYENNNMLKKKKISDVFSCINWVKNWRNHLLRIVLQTSKSCVIIRQRTWSRTCSELSLLLLRLLRKKLWLEIVLVGWKWQVFVICVIDKQSRGVGKPVKVALNVKNLCAINAYQRKYCVLIA